VRRSRDRKLVRSRREVSLFAEHITRRDLLKGIPAAAAGLLFAPSLVSGRQHHLLNGSGSKAALVHDPDATSGTTINQSVVQSMMDEAIMALTGTSTPQEAWLAGLPGLTRYEVIGIKVNCINRYCSSHPEVVQTITNRLTEIEIGGAPFPENNIIIWDRTDLELQRAGYAINDSTSGIRCFGSNHSGVGYDYSMELNVSGVTQYPSKILSQFIDRSINVCVLKDHNISDFTMSLKNHYGSINDPESLHGGSGSPYIAVLNDLPLIRDKEDVFIADCLFGIYRGGPHGQPQLWQTYPEGTPNTLIVASDPVALEFQGLDIVNRERESRGLSILDPAYLRKAVELGLGVESREKGRRAVERVIREHKEGSMGDDDVLRLVKGYLR
jgi:uncharacterized protein (DUF362 family)